MNEDIERYEQMLADDPQSRAFAPLAEAHRKLGNLDEAIRVAKAGLELHPGYSGGLVVLGRALYEKGELDNAAEILQKAVSENPESYLGQKFLGKVLMDKGDNKGAQSAFDAANFLSPEDEEVKRLLEEAKSKASPPEKMVYQEKKEEQGERAQIVTYEQKPTTVDGIELPPLPNDDGGGTFSFTSEDAADPAVVTPVPAAETDVLPGPMDDGAAGASEDDMTATVIEEEEVDQAMTIESFEDLGPEAAAFILEGEGVMDESLDPVTDELPPAARAPSGSDLADGEAPAAQATVPAPPAGLPEPPPEAESRMPEVRPAAVDPSPSTPPPAPGAEEGPGRGPAAAPLAPEQTRPREELPQPGPGTQAAVPVASEEPVPSAPPVQEPAAVAGPGTEPGGQAPEPAPPTPPSAEGVWKDQFSTETLADLYTQQGLVEKAVPIYRQILEQAPENEGVRRKLEALQLQRPAEAGPGTEAPLPGETPPGPSGDRGNQDVLSVLEGLLANVERIKRS